jgi:Mrr N-terminal domain
MPLSEFPGVQTPPKYESEFLRFMNPLLDAMREKGGQARPREIYDAIAQRLNLSEEERTVTNKNGYPRFENQIAWARSALVKTGYLDSPSHGIWRLTDKGKEAHLDGPDIDSIWRRVLEMNTLAKAGTETATTAESGAKNKPSTKDEEDEAIAPSPQTSPYSDRRPGPCMTTQSGKGGICIGSPYYMRRRPIRRCNRAATGIPEPCAAHRARADARAADLAPTVARYRRAALAAYGPLQRR